MQSRTIQILACSPRVHGNSDHMAQCFARGVLDAGGNAHVYYLREHTISPCIACRACASAPHFACPLPDAGQVVNVLDALKTAPLVFITAPIYFYHLPAQFKALIDRSQYLWEAYAQKTAIPLRCSSLSKNREQRRPAMVGLVAGRPQGEELFTGALQTLRYFFALLGFSIVDTCLLRGFDQHASLAQDAAACEQCYNLGRRACAHALEQV